MIFAKLSEKSRVIIAVVLFVAVFAGLLVAASFTDLEVSDILTKDALADGEYLSHDVFGVAFEIFGSSPISAHRPSTSSRACAWCCSCSMCGAL